MITCGEHRAIVVANVWHIVLANLSPFLCGGEHRRIVVANVWHIVLANWWRFLCGEHRTIPLLKVCHFLVQMHSFEIK